MQSHARGLVARSPPWPGGHGPSSKRQTALVVHMVTAGESPWLCHDGVVVHLGASFHALLCMAQTLGTTPWVGATRRRIETTDGPCGGLRRVTRPCGGLPRGYWVHGSVYLLCIVCAMHNSNIDGHCALNLSTVFVNILFYCFYYEFKYTVHLKCAQWLQLKWSGNLDSWPHTLGS